MKSIKRVKVAKINDLLIKRKDGVIQCGSSSPNTDPVEFTINATSKIVPVFRLEVAQGLSTLIVL